MQRGQLLATLYDGDLTAQVRVGEADVTVARAAVDQAGAQGAAAAPGPGGTPSDGRASQLVAGGSPRQEDDDRSVRQRDVTDAELQRARVTEVASARQVQKAQATVRYARERLADTRIVAPFDGLVVKRARDPGNVVVPGDAILQLISLDTMWVAAWVDETAMAAVRGPAGARRVPLGADRALRGHGGAPPAPGRPRDAGVPGAAPADELGDRPAGRGLHRDRPARGRAGARCRRLAPGRAQGVFVEQSGRSRWRP